MRLRWLQSALVDLEAIGDALGRQNPSAAEQVTARIVHVAENLADLPGMGRPGRVVGTRELIVSGTPYIVAYRMRGETVELLGVIHAARQRPERFD